MARSENSKQHTASKTSGIVTLPSDERIQLYYELFRPTGSDRADVAPVIVLSNSLGANTALWEHFVDSFSSQYAILTYDPRFHGKSPLPTDPNLYDYNKGHDIADLSSDLVALLDALQIKKVFASIGLSIGGAVVLAAGASNPDRFDHIFVVGTKAEPVPGDVAAHDERIKLANEQGLSVVNDNNLVRWFGDAWLAQNSALARAFKEKVLFDTPVPGFIASVQALKRMDLWGYADIIKRNGQGSKFIFVVGEADAASVVADSKALAERAGPGAEFVTIKDAGHIVNVQRSAEFEELVRSRVSARSN